MQVLKLSNFLAPPLLVNSDEYVLALIKTLTEFTRRGGAIFSLSYLINESDLRGMKRLEAYETAANCCDNEQSSC